MRIRSTAALAFGLAVTIGAGVAGVGVAGEAAAQDSGHDGSGAALDAFRLVGNLGASGVKTASAVAVVPASVGAVALGVGGSAAHGAADVLWNAGASAAAGASTLAIRADAPLPVSPDVVVAAPPPDVPYAAQEAPPR